VRKLHQTQTPTINLTPILGLVAILIPLLLMAYLPHALAVIDTEVPAICGGCTVEDEPPLIVPKVQISRTGITLDQVVVEPGAAPRQTELPCAHTCKSAADYDWSGMQDALARTRAETNGNGGVTIIVADDVSYEVLVDTMDACRERLHTDGTREPLYPHPTLDAAG